ncbi:molybdopterin-dependent oxidoreductase [Microbacter sp. GSS18]|nr:molybdopterin-dependent oxidoreductase [Microbacter sp. GSS18]
MASLTARASDRLERAFGAARARTRTPGRRTRTTVVLGRVLGVMLIVCFATGLYSHVLQNPLDWLPLLPRPVHLYRVTQGLHVITGLALIPVLLGKLWSVYPRLFAWPPVSGPVTLLERGSIALLVGAAVLEVALGVMNIAQWYPFPFSFRAVHFVLAWVLVGAMILHIGIKLPLIQAYWRRRPDGSSEDEPTEPRTWPDAPDPDTERQPTVAEGVSRRGALIAVGSAAGVVALATAGQTVAPLAPLAVLAPRRPGIGPQGLPVNRTAAEAGVIASARSPEWRLTVVGPDGSADLSLMDLRSMPQHTVELPIACVEGWSQNAVWTGVRVQDVIALVGAGPDSDVRFTSLQTRGAFATSRMRHEYVSDPLSLIALRLGGETLDIEHGYPARVIAPGRPGVRQTKWLSAVEVTT